MCCRLLTSSTMYRPELAILWIVSIIPVVLSQCYSPDGRLDPSPDFLPCPGSTICCAINRKNFPGGNVTRDGYTRDECLPNGLCQNRGKVDSGKEETSFWRNTCADKDWKSGNCLNVCTTGVRGFQSSLPYTLAIC